MAEEWKDLARVWWNDIAMLGHDLAQGRHGNPLKFYDWLQSFAGELRFSFLGFPAGETHFSNQCP